MVASGPSSNYDEADFNHGLLGVSAYLLVSLFQPLLIDRFRALNSDRAVGARYEPRFNMLTLHPDSEYDLPVRITNTGRERWRSDGRRRITLSYYWYDVRMQEIIELEAEESLLPEDIEAGGTVEVVAKIRTPSATGLHLLDLDLRQRGYGEFSIAGVYPGVVEVELDATVRERFDEGDVSRWYRRGPEFRPALDASVSRRQLWSAAFQIARDHPVLGAGPDSFRLMYGGYLGFSRWGDNIRSNNMYLELLATVGALGLVAFALVIGSARYTWTPAVMAVGVFLLHGLVDVFLMTTPIYFAFWMLLGFADEDRV